MKKIAVIGCLDTKEDEIKYLSDSIRQNGLESFIIDVSLREHGNGLAADLATKEIIESCGLSYKDFHSAGKADALSMICGCLPSVMKRLWAEGIINGAISAGGMQNSIMARCAMEVLPFGVPKIIISSMACGLIDFERIVGRSDICVFPAVADVVGVNPISKIVFDNAIAALTGMVKANSQAFKKDKNDKIIGITCAGVTVKGAEHASHLLKKSGYKTCFFHGVLPGGLAMEDLVEQGVLDGVLDLMPHAVLTEAIGYYNLSLSPDKRLKRLAKSGIPAVVSLSGMDVIDMTPQFFETFDLPDKENRKIYRHNSSTLHVKATPEEVKLGGRLLVERLNEFTGPVTVVMANNGFRANAMHGGELYDPEVDRLLMDIVAAGVRKDIRVVEINANANDILFSQAVVNEFLSLAE